MRKPLQVLAFPFVKRDDDYYFAIFRRRDMGIWQGIAGGCENNETPLEAIKREAYEEASIDMASQYIRLSSTTTIPAANIHGVIWGTNIIMVPEIVYGIKINSQELKISNEHNKFLWASARDAIKKLKYDSNRSAVWELDYRLKNNCLNGVGENLELIRKVL
jgi:dATP pyrophosphohydrolase